MLLIVYYLVFMLGGSLSAYLIGLIVGARVWQLCQPHRFPRALFSILVDLLAACGLDDPTKTRGTRCTALAWPNRCGKSGPVDSAAAGRGHRAHGDQRPTDRRDPRADHRGRPASARKNVQVSLADLCQCVILQSGPGWRD